MTFFENAINLTQNFATGFKFGRQQYREAEKRADNELERREAALGKSESRIYSELPIAPWHMPASIVSPALNGSGVSRSFLIKEFLKASRMKNDGASRSPGQRRAFNAGRIVASL